MASTTVLISRERIAKRVAELGQAIARDLEAEKNRLTAAGQAPGPVVMVPILTGAMLFTADLIRNIPISMSIRPVTLSSYPGAKTTSQGVTTVGGVDSLPADLRGKRIIITDDIYDSGQTLGLLRRVFASQQPPSLRIAVLLTKQKPAGRAEEVQIDYSGFEIEDRFVVGYGLDYDGLYRNRPDVEELHLT